MEQRLKADNGALQWQLVPVVNDATSEPLQLHKLLTAETMDLNLAGSQKEEILRLLVNKVVEIRDNAEARDRLLRALMEREQLHSTGIGDGVALPHARNALVGLVQRPVLVFGRHSQGISYGSIDGKAARLFFLLVAPNVTMHLQILARLSRILRHARSREELLLAGRAERIVQIIRDAESKL